jgi:hypothetical protein
MLRFADNIAIVAGSEKDLKNILKTMEETIESEYENIH